MYHQIGVQKLSPTQISKLLNGHRVRVKHGSSHNLNLSQEQHKKLMSAHKKGMGSTIQFDPYQCTTHSHLKKGHGEGDILSNIKRAFTSTWNKQPTSDEQHILKNMLGVQDTIASNVPVLGQIWHPVSSALHNKYGVGEGMKKHRKRTVGRPRKMGHGEGPISDILSQFGLGEGEGIKHRKRTVGRPRKMGHGEGPISDILSQFGLGEGVKHRKRTKKTTKKVHHAKGGSFFKDVMREAAPVAKEIGIQLLKKKLGLGEGAKRRTKKCGGALNPAGYGEGKRRVGRPRKMGHGEGPISDILSQFGLGEGVKRRGRKPKHFNVV